jgi:DNA helicase-2/ATP-dependent DNA helicase PcrA
VSLERNRRQLEVYSHLIEERTGQKVSKMSLYYTGETDNPYITFRKNDETIGKTIAAFNDIVTRIEHNYFRIESRPTKKCSDCDMQKYCNNIELVIQELEPPPKAAFNTSRNLSGS